MKKQILLLFFASQILLLFSQETFSSAGEKLNNSQANINFTVGEPIINELSLNGNTILCGYQQPILKIETIDIKETENWNVNIFPNPTQSFVYISWNTESIKEIQYQLFDINGKLIYNSKSKDLIMLNLQDLASGNYLLKLKNKKQIQTYKIQKIK